MKNKINVAELLKNCPKGMELDCTMFDGVYFDHVDDLRLNRIKCYVNNGNEHFEIAFEETGQYISNDSAKCVIFPKGKTTWEGFVPPCQFKDGDIAVTDKGDIHLLRTKDSSYCAYRKRWNGLPKFDKTITTSVRVYRLSTEEEKQVLFDAIKENGYRWNAETNTLEKLVEPKFKVGDRIKTIYNDFQYDIKELDDTHYTLVEVEDKFEYTEPIIEDENWKLVPDKFDITTLVPFESRVLVRNDESQYWIPAFWGCKRADGYTTTFGWCKYCIPFEGNEHLLETNNDCDEYFKTWK